jgi:hypothetical protein
MSSILHHLSEVPAAELISFPAFFPLLYQPAFSQPLFQFP